MKQQIEVDVPLDCEIAAVERDNFVEIGDEFYSAYTVSFRRLRPKWQYPEWLGGAGVAMDANGAWYLYSAPATCKDGVWFIPQGTAVCIDDRFPLWTPPHCDDWRKSWHPNPRA